ncbi:hypothetical protein B0T22DRAFT_506772 [Podospora appendiculata]|uniref:Integral membrane protein n=1 Tax=Podospora appendiculata TaxID=314037 RepID=A0AAE0XJ52_9PEZI|nr:hypothetical protein B0T22DRAFT_506772 [Podospora appendiculata]
MACGPLYDVNGACVPPAAAVADAAAYDNCFCKDARLTAFKAGTAGVCDTACTATPADLGSIQGWYTSFCANIGEAGTTSTSTAVPTPGEVTGPSGNTYGSSWIQGHYQWIIFLVIIIVAIVGIWIGACIWRRRYLRKRDRQFALGHNLAHTTSSGNVVPNASNGDSVHVPGAGMFEPAPLVSAGIYDDREKPKKEKRKWIVRERT